jgi:hypothetical protein
MSFEPDKAHLFDYAVVGPDGVVVNVVVWDGQPTKWQPQDGHTLVAIPFEDVVEDGVIVRRIYKAGIGWDYVDGQFVDNRPTEVDDDLDT